MIAARLLQRIETNWEQIALAVMIARNQDPELPHYKHLSDDEIRYRVRDLTANLARWMASPDEARSIEHFEQLGRRRYLEGMPLHEVLLKLTVLKRAIHTYASDQNYSLTPMEIYDELELLRAMATYFDLVIFRVAKGYDEVARQDREYSYRRTG
ncbi:MAG: hypothetical protein K2X03_23310 [Bryobacteraceae bacterium]|nr:hypothetical protein [Bryobacteraceae bacterium]